MPMTMHPSPYADGYDHEHCTEMCLLYNDNRSHACKERTDACQSKENLTKCYDMRVTPEGIAICYVRLY